MFIFIFRKHPVNASVQPEARSMTSKEAEEIESSDDYCMFLKETLPRQEIKTAFSCGMQFGL